MQLYFHYLWSIGFRLLDKTLRRKVSSETSYVNVPNWMNSFFAKLLYGEAKLHRCDLISIWHVGNCGFQESCMISQRLVSKRVLRFAIIGVCNAIITFSILNIAFYKLHQAKIISSIIATSCALCL